MVPTGLSLNPHVLLEDALSNSCHAKAALQQLPLVGLQFGISTELCSNLDCSVGFVVLLACNGWFGCKAKQQVVLPTLVNVADTLNYARS